jgi:galactose-1-phosphate uridylyltransferase
MGKFKSVVFYRNHGYMSGGTIHHPHSQIVGFKTYDYHDDIHPYHLLGTPILTEAGIEINLSVRPIIGFYEVNLILSDKTKLDRFVRYMQVTSTYFRHSFVSFNDSYNIFFYDFPNDDKLYVKIVPRFLTNPLYVGYMIAQIANGGHSQRFIDALKKDLQKTK